LPRALSRIRPSAHQNFFRAIALANKTAFAYHSISYGRADGQHPDVFDAAGRRDPAQMMEREI